VVSLRLYEALDHVGANADHDRHVAGAHLIHELSSARQIPQSVKRLLAQCGSLQGIDIGYGVVHCGVSSPGVPGKGCAAQFFGRPRRHEVGQCLFLEAKRPTVGRGAPPPSVRVAYPPRPTLTISWTEPLKAGKSWSANANAEAW
jgi:hypothetical protein